MFHTKICKFDEFGYPVHLSDFDFMIPNLSVGMLIQVRNKKYIVHDIRTVIDKDICRQIIDVGEF